MMEDAVAALVKTQSTTDPILKSILFAEGINRRNGGVLVKPWELDEIPEDFAGAYLALHLSIRKQVHTSRLEGYHAEFRRKNPSYRKY